jgi:hypothetical protein
MLTGFFQILGLDAEPVRHPNEVRNLLLRHFAKISSHHIFSQSRLIFIPEDNLGMESSHMDAMVNDLDNVTTYWDGKHPGLHKTERVTREYQILMAQALATNSIRFDRSLFTVTREKTVQSMRDMLQEQMCRFQWLVKKPNNDYGEARVKLTGKIGNQQDDLLIGLFMVLYGGRLVTCNPGRLNH